MHLCNINEEIFYIMREYFTSVYVLSAINVRI